METVKKDVMCFPKDGDIGKDEVSLSILNRTDDKVDILNRPNDKVDILNISDRSPAQPFKPLNDSLTITHDTFNHTILTELLLILWMA